MLDPSDRMFDLENGAALSSVLAATIRDERFLSLLTISIILVSILSTNADVGPSEH